MPNQARRYQEVEIKTASPMELVLLLYDAAVANLRKAEEHMAAHNITSRTACLNKATSILTELQANLDFEIGGAMARSLDRLYRYMKNNIFQANLHQDAAPLKEVVQLMASLREAWEEVARVEMRKSGPPAADMRLVPAPAVLPMAQNVSAAPSLSNLNITA